MTTIGPPSVTPGTPDPVLPLEVVEPFSGTVLQPPRFCQANHAQSSEPKNGIVRDVKITPDSRNEGKKFADLAGEQYKASLFNNGSHEYLVWVAQSGQIAHMDGWEVEDGRQELKFWWTRNDKYNTRFGWNGKHQRWEPLKGTKTEKLGRVGYEEVFTVKQFPRNFPVGAILRNFRTGKLPDETSSSLVVEVVASLDSHAFSSTSPAGAIEQTTGKLKVRLDIGLEGETVWFIPQSFFEDNDGLVGEITEELFIAPIPDSTDHPFLKINNRRYLQPVLVANETDLTNTALQNNQVGVALTTGRIRLPQSLVNKANPKHAQFDKHWYKAKLYYTGVALNAVPQPLKEPQRLMGEDGFTGEVGKRNLLYLPKSQPWQEYGSGDYKGLGLSGVLYSPDGTGSVFNPEGVVVADKNVSVRPGGDDLNNPEDSVGLIRQVEDGVGDTVLFAPGYAVEKVVVVPSIANMPKHPHKCPKGVAYIAKEPVNIPVHGLCSPVQLDSHTRKNVERLWFRQATLQPSIRTRSAKVYSRNRHVFRFEGNEKFEWVDGTGDHTWSASSLPPKPPTQNFYTPEEVAESIGASCSVENGRLVLSGVQHIAIKFTETSALKPLGFLPGWFAVAGETNWMSDSGVSFGVFRNALNLNAEKPEPDYHAEIRLEEEILDDKIKGFSLVQLNHAPIEDIPGFADNVFFSLQNVIEEDDGSVEIQYKHLNHLGEIQHDFAHEKFNWIDWGSQRTKELLETHQVNLGAQVIPEGFVAGGGLHILQEGGFTSQELDEDFILKEYGQAVLITRYGSKILEGIKGTLQGGTFTDSLEDLSSISEGSRLKINKKSFTVIGTGTSLKVSPEIEGSLTGRWEIFKGFREDVYDPMVVVDQQYDTFTHLPEEPWKVRLLYSPEQFPRLSSHTLELRYNGVDQPIKYLRGVAFDSPKNGLVLPDNLNPSLKAYFGEESFDVVRVAAFSGNPTTLECRNSDNQLEFAPAILDAYSGVSFTIREQLKEGNTPEYDPVEGSLWVPASMQDVKIVETQEVGTDIAISPKLGAIAFMKPLARGTQVEVEYYLANEEARRIGEPIVERLPVFLTEEEPTRITDRKFLVPYTGDITDIEPQVYLGPSLQNYSQQDFISSVTPQGLWITFLRDLPEWVTPSVTFSVYEAQGGERAYNTSQKPVYRPPLYVPAGRDYIGLRGHRTFTPGQMLRLGVDCLYVTKTEYFPASDTTKVSIYPPTVEEIGSRSPAHDALSLITQNPIGRDVFVDGAFVQTDAPEGFMLDVDWEIEPVFSKQQVILVKGDQRDFAVAGSILELDYMPFTIASVQLVNNDLQTEITLTGMLPRAVTPGVSIRISARPVYPAEAQDFLGLGPYLEEEPFELVLYEDGLPGITLREGVDYTVEPNTGKVGLLREPLLSSQKLVFSHTQVHKLTPEIVDGETRHPEWQSKYAFITVPNEDNTYLGGTLVGKYTFENPDTFYYRSVPLKKYIGETIPELVSDLSSGSKPSGPTKSLVGGTENWEQGRLGIQGELRRLLDKDRVSRHLLDFYNQLIQLFEQIEEATQGTVIGDRSGKFRYGFGKGLDHAPPGYEDIYTGYLNPRDVWKMVYAEADPTRHLHFIGDGDALVEPSTAILKNLRLSGGKTLNSSRIHDLIEKQKAFIQNDVDDVLLLGASKPKIRKTKTDPYFAVEPAGLFDITAGTHRFSRLFPTQSHVMFTLFPGIGTDNVYAFRREGDSTYNTQIGQISNPVIGDVTEVLNSFLTLRLPRARVFGFYPTGIPGITPNACIALSQVPLTELVIDPDTGLPDTSEFLSQGMGETPDIVSGSPEEFIPGFREGAQISWGLSDGSVLLATSSDVEVVDGKSLRTGLYVHSIIDGCFVILKDIHGNIAGSGDIHIGDQTLGSFDGDIQKVTCFVIPTDNEKMDPSQPLDPDKVAAIQMPYLREWFDIKVTKDGVVKDPSLPSWYDPFLIPIKEIFGQRVPDPMSHLEGVVDYNMYRHKPLRIPALDGLALDDSGDKAIPYLSASGSELGQYDQISNMFSQLMEVDGIGNAVYPTEYITGNAEVLGAAVGPPSIMPPAALVYPGMDLTTQTGPGKSPAREGDFVFLQVESPSQTWEGITTIGRVSSPGLRTVIEPPRFVSPVNVGAGIAYDLKNFAVHTTPGSYPNNPPTSTPGVRFYTDTSGTRNVISFRDVPWNLNDGLDGQGNLNDVFANDPSAEIVIQVLSRPDDDAVNDSSGAGNHTQAHKEGAVLRTITITNTGITVLDYYGILVSMSVISNLVFGTFEGWTGEGAPGSQSNYRHIAFDSAVVGANIFGMNPTVGADHEWDLPHQLVGSVKGSLYGLEFTVSLQCSASKTSSIEPDRLTFTELVDLRFGMKPRGFQHELNNSLPLETSLEIQGIEDTQGTGKTYNNLGVMTFVSRDPLNPDKFEGEYDGSRGSLRVMGFEGQGNIPLVFQDATVSVQPSYTVKTTEAFAENHILKAVSDVSLFDDIEKGDTVYITGSNNLSLTASDKVGTYVVRYAVEPDALTDYKVKTISADTGSTHLFIKTPYPTVVAVDLTAGTIDVDDPSMLPTGSGNRIAFIYDFDKLDDPMPAKKEWMVSAEYSLVGNVLTLSNWEWADGSSLVPSVLNPSQILDQKLAWKNNGGTQGLDTEIWHGEERAVGYHNAPTFHGVFEITLMFQRPDGSVNTVSNINAVMGFPSMGEVGVFDFTPFDSRFFDPTKKEPLYENILRRIAPRIDATQAGGLYDSVFNTLSSAYLLPGVVIKIDYRIQAGVYLEPSTPAFPIRLDTPGANIVTKSHQSLSSVGLPANPESVSFELRRVRRWHKRQEIAFQGYGGLQKVFEIRRGKVRTFSRDSQQYGELGAVNFTMSRGASYPDVWNDGNTYTGTNLGPFDDPDLNINTGDIVRLLTDDNEVLAIAEIASVIDGGTLKLAPPAFGNLIANQVEEAYFEIYLKQAPVPHEQTHEQLLDVITTKVVLDRLVEKTSNPSKWVGGHVPGSWSDKNKLYDEDSSIDYAALGVRPGDILIIDPYGHIEGFWSGLPPHGSLGVPGRLEHVPGGVYEGFDDNRGFYRVRKVYSDHLEVEPQHEYAGNEATDVIFGDVGGDVRLQFVVYPTVDQSLLNFPGREGQNDLRPTMKKPYMESNPVDKARSLSSFAYKIVRPSGMFSSELIDFVLMSRERMLSLIDQMRTVQRYSHEGYYWDWQNDDVIEALGAADNPHSHIGLFSNDLVEMLLGNLGVSPYINSQNCLSFLDRRFWILDRRLDQLGPDPNNNFQMVLTNDPFLSPSGPYTDFEEDGAAVQPVLPGHLDLILDSRDNLRPIRYTWLVSRVHKLLGTLLRIREYQEKMQELEEDRLDQLRLEESTEGLV